MVLFPDMIVFRLIRSGFHNHLSGIGAEKFGGRWNSKGVAVVYASESRALSCLEIAVQSSLTILSLDYEMISIEIPAKTDFNNISNSALPENWKFSPAIKATQIIGDQFIAKGKYLFMKVPSAVVQGDFNLIINPHHKDIHKIKIIKVEPFSFDKRLFDK